MTRIFYLGLATHFLFQIHPTRGDAARVNPDTLLAKFVPEIPAATQHMHTYSKQNDNIPEGVMRMYYARSVEPVLDAGPKLGFWRKGKAVSNFGNVFWAGALLGMLYDIETAR